MDHGNANTKNVTYFDTQKNNEISLGLKALAINLKQDSPETFTSDMEILTFRFSLAIRKF